MRIFVFINRTVSALGADAKTGTMHDLLLQRFPGVWRADSAALARTLISSGHASLDTALGGGWPQSALLEFLCDQPGIGALQLLLPLLQAASNRIDLDESAQVLWLNPPHVLHAVALAQCGVDPARQWVATGLTSRDALWAMEQALRSGACAVVMAWVERSALSSLRRLKLAASAGQCCGVLFRPVRERCEASPANVRALLGAQGANLQVRLLKVQGRLPATVMLDLRHRAEIGRDAHDAGS